MVLRPKATSIVVAILAATLLHSQVCLVSSFLPAIPLGEKTLEQTLILNQRRIAPHQHDWALFVSSSSSTHASKTDKAGTRVVYQRVVKAPVSQGQCNPLFLGHLVEYLQDHFSLPDRLPMVFESVFDENDEYSMSVQAWDSPMSPSPDATRLDLEVVAIYTEEDKKDKNNVPSMAMVVVRKASAGASSNLPSPIMQNLFADSEKQILGALDRGLDDFMAGKIKLEGTTDTSENPKSNFKQSQDAMIEEFLDNASEDRPSVPPQDNNEKNGSEKPYKNGAQAVMDADFSRVPDKSKSKEGETPVNGTDSDVQKPLSKKESSHPKDQKTSVESSQQDFAVQAAKKSSKVAATSKKRSKTSDFAVTAAQKVAETQKRKKNQNPEKNTGSSQSMAASETPIGLTPKLGTSSYSAAPPIDGHQRAFRATFSTPEEFKKRMNSKKAPKVKKEAKQTQKQKLDNETSDKPRTSSKASDKYIEVNEETTMASSKTKKHPKQKLNLKGEGKDSKVNDAESGKKASKRSDKQTKNDTEVQDRTMPTNEEVIQTAQEVMNEMAEQGTDMSPEELLEDVMKFGKKQDEQNAVGSGFVSGAFEKAKELLKEQKRQRDVRRKNKVIDQMQTEMAQNVQMDSNANSDGPELGYKETSMEEDELKRMFEAGERLAEGRITLTDKDNATSESQQNRMSEKEEQEVDELIAGDKSVSSHARILDEELAELEVRINKSPGEESDGPAKKNPVFDIFSGPEVYNPNVDPETAVNWPGAMPGSKAIEGNRLPKELNEALKQANFASDVLAKMEEKESNRKKSFYVGERELSQQQVDNLRNVVTEAVEVGIIQDPLVLLAERSRLQMVVDELWDQPEERVREIVENYKELLLSDNFVKLIKERLQAMADRDLDALRQSANDDEDSNPLEEQHAREREILGHLVAYAQLLLKEARALGAELEAQQLEVIRSICKVAMDPSHRTEEETATALTDAVRDMRPLFDDMFVSYLKYAVAEEEGRLARAGLLDDPEHNQWLFVLKIVQQGVYAEIAKGMNRYIEHIWYVLRMETATERRMLLSKLIDVMPTLDVRPFVRVVDNIIGSLGAASKGEFDGGYTLGEMTNKLLQLHRDMKELLPPERIDEMSRDADEWAAKQRERLMEQRKLTKQRLKAARDTEHLDEEIESLGKRGEMERFD